MDIHVLRNLVMRYGAELKLTSVEKECLWHLLDHDHDGKGYCYPSALRISKRMGISHRYAQAVIDRLAKKYNLISINHRVGTSNQYRYHGAMKALTPMLQRELGKGKKRVERSEKQLDLLNSASKTYDPQIVPPYDPQIVPPTIHSSTPLRSTDRTNSASEHFKENSSILTPVVENFDCLLEYWNDMAIIVHTIAPRDEKADSGRRSFFEAVSKRLAEGHTWDDLRQAIQNYHDVLVSDEHRFNFRWTITQFINRGFDQFLDRKTAWENYKKSNFEKKGNSYAEQQAQSLKRYREAVAFCEREDREVSQ